MDRHCCSQLPLSCVRYTKQTGKPSSVFTPMGFSFTTYNTHRSEFETSRKNRRGFHPYNVVATLDLHRGSCGRHDESIKWDMENSGSTCLRFTWIPRRNFAYGYHYKLFDGHSKKLVVSGFLPKGRTSIQIDGLVPSSLYHFELIARCSPRIFGRPVRVFAMTYDSCPTYLGPFIQTNDNPEFFNMSTDSFTALLSFDNYDCVSQPVLTWNSVAPPKATILQLSPTAWQISDLAEDHTVDLKFSSNSLSFVDCNSCCVPQNDALVDPFSITTPTEHLCDKRSFAVQTDGLPGATCLGFRWTPPTTSLFASGYNWRLKDGTTIVDNGTEPNNVSSIEINSLSPSTTYTFEIQGLCSPDQNTTYVSANSTTTSAKTPALGAFTQTPSNPIFTVNGGTATMQLTYSSSLQTCVENLVLTSDDGYPVTDTGNNVWKVENVPINSTANFVMSADGAGATCKNGCDPAGAGVPVSTDISINTTVVVPSGTAPYTLTITNYGGPPKRITNLYIESDGNGPITSTGSYLQQVAVFSNYAERFVNGFVKHNAQSRKFQNGAYHLPISSIYVGITGDPVEQGGNPVTGAVKKSYSYTDSSSTINPPTTEPFQNWRDPPVLKMFLELIKYNWNVSQSTSGYSNPQYTQLALNLYGSKKNLEQWFFNVQVDPTTGEITTAAPSDPKKVASIVDNIPNDGNGDQTLSCGPNPLLAGWNCLERWFMFVAYCNQRLRRFIELGEVPGMTLSDIGTSLDPKYCQISSITTDGEGNGFNNTLYPDKEPHTPCDYYRESWFTSVTPAQCNAAMKVLWNKWINQDTSTPTAPAGGWPSQWTNILNVKAIQTRSNMPGTPFTLPCSISMTTPGLLKNMTTSDLGSADFDSVTGIFHEIYDTSDNAPFRCLGADTSAVRECPTSTGTPNKTGVPFTQEVKTNANPTDPTDEFAKKPETFGSSEYGGVWDNLVLPGHDCAAGLEIVGGKLQNGTVSSSLNAFNDSTLPMAPRMSTSEFNPWHDASNSIHWQLTKSNPPVSDVACAGWNLEGSRYDLYNGMWAKESAETAEATTIDYSLVKQGENSADGGLLWTDLSTGLKPRTASIMKNVSNADNAVQQVWMLSCQSGPFVNNMGVRQSARNYNGAASSDDIFGFACPDSAISSDGYWPGWKGMAGQWYGPGTKDNANSLGIWATDQMPLPPLTTPSPFNVLTGSTEDNFGVFYDLGIQEAAWNQMAKDLRGEYLNPNGISDTTGFKYSDAAKPNLGCYELAFIPLSWYGPE